MSGFTKTVKREYQFDGDTVTVIFSRFKRKHMSMVLEHVPTDGSDMNPKQAMALLNELAPVLPEIVKKFEGLTDSDGEAISLEEAANESYFSELFAEIFGDIAEESFLSAGASGN